MSKLISIIAKEQLESVQSILQRSNRERFTFHFLADGEAGPLSLQER